MRICRIASFPTDTSPGTGLPGYFLCKAIRVPTLFLTRRVPGLKNAPPHVRLNPVPYFNPPFGERIDPFRLVAKLAGLFLFFVASIPSMVRFRPDIVHIHSPHYIPHAIFARFILGARVCVTFHGSDLLRIRRSRLLQSLLKVTADRFFYVSTSMQDDLKKFIPSDRMVYTPNGVDPERFRDLGMKRERRVVAVGNLRWQKGYQYLIEAFYSLKNTGYTLVIVGEGPLRGELQALIDKLNLGERVLLAGRKNHQQIIRLLNTSRLFVMSSLSEGFPKALVEAIACGLPVVVTGAGCCREVSGEVGLCVEPGRVESLARALRKMIENNELREKFAENTGKTASRYSWNRSCRKVAESYSELTGGKLPAETDTGIPEESPARSSSGCSDKVSETVSALPGNSSSS